VCCGRAPGTPWACYANVSTAALRQ
jgi:hypothetical protein